MNKLLLVSLLATICFSCKTSSKLKNEATNVTVYDSSLAVMQWNQQTVDLGKVKLGEKRKLEYSFTNICLLYTSDAADE